jgi:FtsZ-binding cell division protein ZapB
MKKTSQEKEQHTQKITAIANQLAEEYATWTGELRALVDT